jgi:hypothetical protein
LTGDLEAGARLRDFPQMFEHQSVEGFGSVERKAVAELAIEFSQEAAAFNEVAAAGLRVLTARLDRSLEDLKVVQLAGAFGNCISRAGAQRIGLLPVPAERVRHIGRMTLIRRDRRDHIELWTLDRPDRLNALPDLEDGEAFAAACEAVNADQSVRCVVLTGAGRAFSAGGDLKAAKLKLTQVLRGNQVLCARKHKDISLQQIVIEWRMIPGDHAAAVYPHRSEALAGLVYCPLVTKMPLCAPPAAIDPSSSRIFSTPTLLAFQCLHCT